MPRKHVFQNFDVSGLPESVFFRFFELRGPPTVHFHKKQLVGASRNLIFLNFYLSGCPEAHFSAFSAHCLQAKCCFWQFSMKNHERRAIFGVFCISLTSDEWFSAFFVFPSRGKVGFHSSEYSAELFFPFSSLQPGVECSFLGFQRHPTHCLHKITCLLEVDKVAGYMPVRLSLSRIILERDPIVSDRHLCNISIGCLIAAMNISIIVGNLVSTSNGEVFIDSLNFIKIHRRNTTPCCHLLYLISAFIEIEDEEFPLPHAG